MPVLEPFDSPRKHRRYLKRLRADRLALKKRDPATFNMLRRMTDQELRLMEADLIATELARLRLDPRFSRDAELQRQAADHDYRLRLIDEIERSHEYNITNPRKIRRYCPQVLPITELEIVPPTSLAAVANPFTVKPPTEPEPTKPAIDDGLYSKFFNTTDSYDVW
jgi:hypothetical protein